MAAASTSNVKKRKNVDFATKLKAIQRVEAGEKKSTVADDFGIPRSTLSTLLKNKADIKSKAAEQRTSGVCRVRAPAHEKVEKALYAWFLEVRAQNILVDGPMLMAKAKWFAAALGEDNFADNTGWLQRFKNRHNIVGKTIWFCLIRRCCGDMEGTGLSHLDSLEKIEASVFIFICKTKKQAKISDFFSRQ